MKTINLTIFYFRKFFTIKNLIWFVIGTLAFWSTSFLIIQTIDTFNSSIYTTELNSDFIRIGLMGSWINIFLCYSYFYLSKNQISNFNNSIAKMIIVGIL